MAASSEVFGRVPKSSLVGCLLFKHVPKYDDCRQSEPIKYKDSKMFQKILHAFSMIFAISFPAHGLGQSYDEVKNFTGQEVFRKLGVRCG